MANIFRVEIVSPERSVFRGHVQKFSAPGVHGSFQILANHAPLLAATDVGPVTLTTATGEEITFATSGGFVEVLDNRVIMLAETAEPVTDIDVDRAQAAEQRALERLQSTDASERRTAQADLDRARNRLRIAMGSVGSKRGA